MASFTKSFRRINSEIICRALLIGLCSIGISVSIYAYYVETRKELDATYQASCDIAESVSCSKVFTSKYGRGFGLLEYVVGKKHWLNQPNSVFGVMFYMLQITLGLRDQVVATTLQCAMSVVANMASVYLGYILTFVLHDACVVCITTYVINFAILVCNVRRKFELESEPHRKSKASGAIHRKTLNHANKRK